MSLKTYTNTLAVTPGAGKGLVFSEERTNVVLVDTRIDPKPARYGANAVGCLELVDTENGAAWKSATMYLKLSELAELCNLIPDGNRGIVETWQERIPVYTKDGEIKLGRNGNELYDLVVKFAPIANHGSERFDSFNPPERAEAPAQSAFAAFARKGPPPRRYQ